MRENLAFVGAAKLRARKLGLARAAATGRLNGLARSANDLRLLQLFSGEDF